MSTSTLADRRATDEHADARFMRRALEVGRRGLGRTSPNPPVGAVVVRDGDIVGEGWHRRAGEDHAEVVALAAAGDRARGATLYCTLEPCSHQGRTPPCAPQVVAAGIRRAVVGAIDPNPRVRGRGLRVLRSAGVEATLDVEAEAARELIRFFGHHVRTGRPFVRLKLATSADGRIATRRGESTWISCRESRNLVHRWRDEMDAVMVGVGTALSDDPRLTCRRRGGRDPVRIVLDSTLRLRLGARLLDGTGGPVWVASTRAASVARRRRLEARGVRCLLLPARRRRVSLDALFRNLGRDGIVSVLVEGGSELGGALLARGLVDEICWFSAPILIGGDGLPMISSLGVTTMQQALQLDDVRVMPVGRDWLYSARPVARRGKGGI